MRSGCSLPSTVLLLLFLGLVTWAMRHWQPSFVCNTPLASWFCDGTSGRAGPVPTTKAAKPPAQERVVAGTSAKPPTKKPVVAKKLVQPPVKKPVVAEKPPQPPVKKPVVAKLATGVPHPFPWPIADNSIEWSNFREGAYSIPSVAPIVAKLATGVPHPSPWPVADESIEWSNFREGAYSIPSVAPKVEPLATGVPHPFPWPVAEDSIEWTNFREGAYSIPAVAPKVEPLATGVPHPFPWPVAENSIEWSNFREGAYSIPAVAPKLATGVAHPFPWPIADEPVTWTNFRKPPKPKKIVAKTPVFKTEPHPFPWPVADESIEWSNFREGAYSIPAVAPKVEPLATGVAHPFPWPIADEPVTWTNFREPPPAPEPEPPKSPDVPYSDTHVAHDPAPPRNGLALLEYRVKKETMRKASDCGDELNRVARDGVILFETGSAKLTSSSYDTLDKLAGVAKTCDQVSITVEGHTDNRGSASFNQGLSERRAQSVAAYLQGAGIAGDSLSAVGFGESRPAVSNSSSENRAKNRRIEFSVSGS